MDGELQESDERRLKYYRECIGRFVTVIKKDGHTVAGILIDITADDHLFIKGYA